MVTRALSAASFVEVAHNDQLNEPSNPETHRLENFKKFCWDPEEKKLCRITFLDWVRILFLYALFLSAIGGICIGTYEFGSKLVGYSYKDHLGIKSPSVTPIGDRHGSFADLIHVGSAWNMSGIVNTSTNTPIHGQARSGDTCADDDSGPCYFDWSLLGPCSVHSDCLYLALNKFMFWVPDCINFTDLPDEVSERMLPYVGNYSTEIQENQNKLTELEAVWLECEGNYPPDREHLGPYVFFPFPGWESKYFPFDGNENYAQPIVAIYTPLAARNILITIKCHVWAKNTDLNKETYLQLYYAKDYE